MDTAQSPQQPATIVTDDWTRNWHAKIAIKITAMFMWLIILTAFGGLVYYTQDLESEFTNEVNDELDGSAYTFSHILSSQASDDPAAVREHLRTAATEILQHSHSRLKTLSIRLGDTRIDIGEPTPGLTSSTRTATYRDLSQRDEISTFTLEATHKDAEGYARSTRERLLILVVSIILVLGMLLRWTIHNVLAKPFQVLMDATQAVSTGNLDIRLDVSREDEFGHLSRFFNQMLDRISEQRQELTVANSELKNEVAVRKQAEGQLREHRDELERLVIERTQDLELARDQALRASHTKSAFIANISHEIRTPLTPIIGFAEAMLNGHQSEADRRQSLQSIIRNGKHLLNIINDILDLSKIEADKLEVECIPVNLQQLVSDVESVAGVLAREKGLEFNVFYIYPIPRVINTDPTRLKQILMNIAMNAIKFTERGMVSIDVAYDTECNQIVMGIVDTGVGIAQEKVDRLFKAFSQADSSTTRQFGGTGLGLYISRRLAKLLGGDISLQSELGVGSRFTIRIDAGEVDLANVLHESSSKHIADEPSPIENIRLQGSVLLAEDSPDNQRLITYYLNNAGVEVTVAENGQIAFETAMSRDFDLILMDMQMPIMGGLEAVELLRNSGYASPIVALTANAMKEDREHYDQVGCDGFLSKPIELDKFYAVLASYLQPADTAIQQVSLADLSGFEHIVAQFLDGLPEYIDQLEACCRDEDAVTAKPLVHQLKGMGGAFGYPRITELAKAADAEFRHGRAVEGFLQTRQLLAELHGICATQQPQSA